MKDNCKSESYDALAAHVSRDAQRVRAAIDTPEPTSVPLRWETIGRSETLFAGKLRVGHIRPDGIGGWWTQSSDHLATHPTRAEARAALLRLVVGEGV